LLEQIESFAFDGILFCPQLKIESVSFNVMYEL